jgi:carboxypeptidase PM20D1
MTGTTDSRWYRNLTDAIYRFIPLEVSSQDMQGVHGFNESISLDAWAKSVDFLEGLIRNSHSGGSK